VQRGARGWEEKNRKLLKDAKEAGIATREPAGDSKRARYHYKVMTVDGEQAFVFTFNPTRENLHYTRDFGVETHSPAIAAEIDRLFAADWDDRSFTPDSDLPLLISPFNSRQKIEQLLDSARFSLHIADARVADPAIIRLLVGKARSGVQVRVLGDDEHGNALPEEIEFRAVPRYKLHAKCVIIDGTTAVIGSMNLRTESLDRRRELSIAVDDRDILRRLNAVFASDWERKAPGLDSTDTQLIRVAREVPAALGKSATTGFVLVSRTNALARHELREGVTRLGRAPENDVVIGDAAVSRYHALITLDKGSCRITDLYSGNGTFLNGERVVGTTWLWSGDVIRFAERDEFRLLELT
jgi:pSer/pThr/pTyr-binding forkhead associated (FHA) protein